MGGGEYAGAGQDLKIKSEMIKSDELGTVPVTVARITQFNQLIANIRKYN